MNLIILLLTNIKYTCISVTHISYILIKNATVHYIVMFSVHALQRFACAAVVGSSLSSMHKESLTQLMGYMTQARVKQCNKKGLYNFIFLFQVLIETIYILPLFCVFCTTLLPVDVQRMVFSQLQSQMSFLCYSTQRGICTLT